MNRIQLKGTELEISRICYGTGNFETCLKKEQAFEMLDLYTESGGNFIDTANVYGRWLPEGANVAEEYVGEWLRRKQNRNQIILATKGGHPDLRNGEGRVTRKELEKDLDSSLKTLGVDYVDFYWLHRDNADLPIEEVIDFADSFAQAGKVRYYGASNFTLPRIEEALAWSKKHEGRGFKALSNQWSLAYPNPGYKLEGDRSLEGVDHSYYLWLKKNSMPLIPYSATANGFFAKSSLGRISERLKDAYENIRNRELSNILGEMADKYNATPLSLSLAFMIAQNDFQVAPVIAVSSTDQLIDALSSDSISLEGEDIQRINTYF